VCIGTSTGGPRALQQVITKLPKTIDAPVLVVQHMPAGFTKSLAVRLDSLAEVHVKEAEEGDIIQKGTVYIAPGGLHLKLKWVGANLAIQLDQSPPRNRHRPAVDVMFESCSELSAYAKISVIMTGMGSDGTKGLIKLKESGNVVAIAESEETSIVFGMPKAAIATKLVDEVKNVDNIAETIMKYV
jgi:two-component system chemotaxis response regulator CheB